MENAAVLTLAGLCFGIALTGLLTAVPAQKVARARLCLGLVYAAFIGMLALPIVRTFADHALIHYMPFLLVILFLLPPAFYHYVLAKTATPAPSRFPWRDLILPAAAGGVCLGFWALSTQTKEMMFLDGELPAGVWPAALALSAFVLMFLWLLASFAYLVAILRRLAAYRAHIRQLYSDVEKRDFRWLDFVMLLIVLIWAAGAFSLADENLTDGAFGDQGLFLALIAGGLLALNIFAPIASPGADQKPPEPEPDLKYARSALTRDHAEKLATRIEKAMRDGALFLDPSLSLQKLSREVGALPNQVSQTLNQEIGESFFDYVSRCRIEASKPLILAGEASVLEVALEVGFNSRSTFYKAFKRETGMTPKAFRESF